jgi:hypothetical protein
MSRKTTSVTGGTKKFRKPQVNNICEMLLLIGSRHSRFKDLPDRLKEGLPQVSQQVFFLCCMKSVKCDMGKWSIKAACVIILLLQKGNNVYITFQSPNSQKCFFDRRQSETFSKYAQFDNMLVSLRDLNENQWPDTQNAHIHNLGNKQHLLEQDFIKKHE